jgi:hypothetical protein
VAGVIIRFLIGQYQASRLYTGYAGTQAVPEGMVDEGKDQA